MKTQHVLDSWDNMGDFHIYVTLRKATFAFARWTSPKSPDLHRPRRRSRCVAAAAHFAPWWRGCPWARYLQAAQLPQIWLDVSLNGFEAQNNDGVTVHHQ